MHLTPAEGGWRVVVVDGAEEMNPAAANALLKVLEEPPPRAVLLLVCAAPGRLLPTIRSRCRRLRLSPLADAGDGRAARPLPAATWPRTSAAGWSPWPRAPSGAPCCWRRRRGWRSPAWWTGVLAALPDLPPHARAMRSPTRSAATRPAFSTFMDLLRAGLAAAVRDAARGRADPEQARLVGARPLDAWGDVWHGLTRVAGRDRALPLDKRQAIVAGLGAARAADARCHEPSVSTSRRRSTT